jgi:NAD(P)-dependent dehydrogenase (short-subunit alcohol dehydrogenase family)
VPAPQRGREIADCPGAGLHPGPEPGVPQRGRPRLERRPLIYSHAGIEEFDENEFNEQLNVKVLGYLRCARAAAPPVKANGWGRVINVSGLAARSSGAITGTVRNVAVAALTKNLAYELGRHGVNVHPRALPLTATRSWSAAGPSARSATDVCLGSAVVDRGAGDARAAVR